MMARTIALCVLVAIALANGNEPSQCGADNGGSCKDDQTLLQAQVNLHKVSSYVDGDEQSEEALSEVDLIEEESDAAVNENEIEDNEDPDEDDDEDEDDKGGG